MSNELVKVINGKTVVSSRDVAENFGKRHSDVIKSVERHVEELSSAEKSVQWFFSSSYRDASGKSCKEYLMNRDGFSLLAMSFNNTRDVLEWKLKYIAAFNSMEQRLTFAIPQTYAEALQLAADQAKELLLAKPKVDFYDAVASSDSLLSMADVAKVLDKGIGRNRLFKLLRSRGILQDNNVPYQRFVDAGYFKVVENSYMAGDNAIVSTVTYVKQKGVDYIRKLLEGDR